MAVTIRDIARKVGVNPSTVSRAMNGNTLISSETRAKIEAAMKELNYHANSLARNFANGSSCTIGLIIDAEDCNTFSNAFFNRSVYAVETAVQQRGYNLLITNNRHQDAEKLVLERKVDGLIVPSSVITPRLATWLRSRSFPFVVLGEPEGERNRVSWIDINNAMGGESAVSHLLENGYRRIACIVENLKTLFARKRAEGYENALRCAGRGPGDISVKETGDDVRNAGKLVREFAESGSMPDAYVCSNNLIAFEVLKTVGHLGLSVPEDVGIVAFDNYPIAEYTEPSLTVIDVDTYSLGEQAAANLFKRIGNPNIGDLQTVISTSLIVRGSSVRKEGAV